MSVKGSSDPLSEEASIWSVASLDAVIVALWTLIIGGAIVVVALDMSGVPLFYRELGAQLSVVAFILLSAYRAGVNNHVDAVTWYGSLYLTLLLFSILVLRKPVGTDLFIQHVFYAMMAFVCWVGAVKMYRYYVLRREKKRNKRAKALAAASASAALRAAEAKVD